MSVEYRSEVKPHYHRWAAEGLARLAPHAATQAGIELANMLLDYKAPPDSMRHTVDTNVERLMKELRDHGVTAEHLCCRVAELSAFLKAHPGRARNTRAERFVYARGVLHLIRRNGNGTRVGAFVMNALGALVMEHLGAWAVKFCDKLERDTSKKNDLKKRAAAYD
jgi:hypothetical protein